MGTGTSVRRIPIDNKREIHVRSNKNGTALAVCNVITGEVVSECKFLECEIRQLATVQSIRVSTKPEVTDILNIIDPNKISHYYGFNLIGDEISDIQVLDDIVDFDVNSDMTPRSNIFWNTSRINIGSGLYN